MSRRLQVLVVFEFDGIDDPDSEGAEEIVYELTQATKEWRTEYGADDVWVDDATVVEGV